MTEGKSGLRASGGKGLAGKNRDAGVVKLCYGCPQPHGRHRRHSGETRHVQHVPRLHSAASRSTHRKAPYGMSAVARGQGRTTDGQEAARARETASAGACSPAWRNLGSWREVSCATRRAISDMPGEAGRRMARRVPRLAGQMSGDTPRPPHETAREYASTGSTAFCGFPMPGKAVGSPITTQLIRRHVPGRWRGRGARSPPRFLAGLPPPDDLTNRSGGNLPRARSARR